MKEEELEASRGPQNSYTVQLLIFWELSRLANLPHDNHKTLNQTARHIISTFASTRDNRPTNLITHCIDACPLEIVPLTFRFLAKLARILPPSDPKAPTLHPYHQGRKTENDE